MRALVTGSTGLLGNNLVRTLLDAGHEVWALAGSKEKAQRGHFLAISSVAGDAPPEWAGAITF
jgi:nucleoside-diphosphate-sugar epimerase